MSRRRARDAKSIPHKGESMSMRMEDVFVTPVAVKINDRYGEVTVGAKGDEMVTNTVSDVIRHYYANIDAFRPIGVKVLGPPSHSYLAMAAMHMHMSKTAHRTIGWLDSMTPMRTGRNTKSLGHSTLCWPPMRVTIVSRVGCG